MIIKAFGNVLYASSYVLPIVKANDDWLVSRPPNVIQVGMADGGFDFQGDDPAPIAPMIISKTCSLADKDYADIGGMLDTLKDMLTWGKRTLWGLTRDGAHRWTWAKCIEVSAPEKQGQYHELPISIKFSAPEGVWYGETEQSHAIVSGTQTITSVGRVPAVAKFYWSLISGTASITNIHLHNLTTGLGFTYTEPLVAGQVLSVDAGKWQVTKTGDSTPYAHFTPEANYLGWLNLQPGANSLSLTYNMTGSITSDDCHIAWHETYL
jgi:hypothetical protein